jgi:hypothetical protein
VIVCADLKCESESESESERARDLFEISMPIYKR